MRRQPFRSAATLVFVLAAGCGETPREAPPPRAAEAQAGPTTSDPGKTTKRGEVAGSAPSMFMEK
jgi:hypothetical protein